MTQSIESARVTIRQTAWADEIGKTLSGNRRTTQRTRSSAKQRHVRGPLAVRNRSGMQEPMMLSRPSAESIGLRRPKLRHGLANDVAFLHYARLSRRRSQELELENAAHT